MKILKVTANNYKNCCNNFTIDLLSKSKKTSEDKEYELQELADELYTFNTAAFIGKNASGKTTARELLYDCYSILGDFRLYNKSYTYDNTNLEIIFYNDGYIYKYNTTLKYNPLVDNNVVFKEQHIYQKKYYKSKLKDIYSTDDFIEITNLTELPEDTSIVFLF